MILANGGFYILPNYLSNEISQSTPNHKTNTLYSFAYKLENKPSTLHMALQIKYTFVCGPLFFSNIENYYLRLGQTKFWH